MTSENLPVAVDRPFPLRRECQKKRKIIKLASYRFRIKMCNSVLIALYPKDKIKKATIAGNLFPPL